MKDYLELGQVVNVRGLKGEVKLNSFTDDNTKFEKLKKVFLKQKDKISEHYIEHVGYANNQVVLKLKNIDTVEQAELLRNSYLLVKRDELEKLPEGTYYIVDLIGLDVVTEQGNYIGKLEDIFNTGSNDVYVVKEESGKERLLPGTDEVIKQIDTKSGKIIVNLIKGL